MTSKIEPKQVKSYLRELESDAKGFLLTHVDENVNWTVSTPATGPQGKTTPFSGICTSRKQFIEEVLIPLNGYFRDDSPLKMEIIDILVDCGDEDSPFTKTCTEMIGISKLKDGTAWENYYSWVFHWSNETKKVVKVRAYFDSAVTNLAIAQEKAS